MIRAVYKTVTWYSPNTEDMKVCSACRDGWAFYFQESIELYVHKPNKKTGIIICRAVNDLGHTRLGHMKRLLAEAA